MVETLKNLRNKNNIIFVGKSKKEFKEWVKAGAWKRHEKTYNLVLGFIKELGNVKWKSKNSEHEKDPNTK